jgi:hypothetical protein
MFCFALICMQLVIIPAKGRKKILGYLQSTAFLKSESHAPFHFEKLHTRFIPAPPRKKSGAGGGGKGRIGDDQTNTINNLGQAYKHFLRRGLEGISNQVVWVWIESWVLMDASP